MGLDYYEILQIKQTSTDLEIKNAYRKLALENNPGESTDGRPLTKVFHLICEAYDALSDPDRRLVFDQYGEEGLKGGVPGPEKYIKPYHYHGQPMRTYKDFFGTTSPYPHLMDFLLNPKPLYDLPEGKGMCKKQPPIRHPLCLTLHEVFFGGVKKMKIQRLEYTGPEQIKTTVKEKILTVPIKPGLRPRTEIVFPEEGDQNPTHIPGKIPCIKDSFIMSARGMATVWIIFLKSYRTLALEFTPARLCHESSKKVFTLISEAYDVLSDPLRRTVFDQYGEEGLKSGVPGPDDYIQPYKYHGDAMKTYREFFGTMEPYINLMNHLKKPELYENLTEGKGMCKKQSVIRHPLCLTLHEVFFGGVKKMKIQRLEYIGPEKTRTEVKEKILSVPIKPGIRPGTEILFPEEGDQNPAHISADIIFLTEDRPHEFFVRENDNLVTEAEITLQEALLGTTITVNTIDHRVIRIPITDIVSPGYEKVVENEGMPVMESPGEKGNLIIRFKVQYPPYLPKASRNLLQKAFSLVRVGGGKFQQELINKMVLADKIMRVDPDEQLPPF